MRPDQVLALLARLPPRPPAPGVLPPPPDWLRPVPTDGSSLPERPPAGSGARVAAALVCLFPDGAGDVRVVLTERVDDGGHHSGEVSLPGGKAEPGELDPLETALREANEEVGLDPAACGLQILGFLEPTWIPASNFVVTPVVGLAARAPALVADPREVFAIFDARLEAFLPDAPRIVLERVVRGLPLRHGAYPVDGRIVWGATARILAQLGGLLAAGQGDRPPA
jgi:8-oxo-dGTP pyrophosphatase MutT (NUDIX family)